MSGILVGALFILDVILVPFGALFTIVTLVRTVPPTRRVLLTGLGYVGYINVAGRALGYSASMFALVLLAAPMTILIDPASTHRPVALSPDQVIWCGTASSLVVFVLLPISVGFFVRAIRPKPRE